MPVVMRFRSSFKDPQHAAGQALVPQDQADLSADLKPAARHGQVVIHLRNAGRQVLAVPHVILDLGDCHALGRVWHQDLGQHIPALLAGLHVGWELILHLQYSLQQ